MSVKLRRIGDRTYETDELSSKIVNILKPYKNFVLSFYPVGNGIPSGITMVINSGTAVIHMRSNNGWERDL